MQWKEKKLKIYKNISRKNNKIAGKSGFHSHKKYNRKKINTINVLNNYEEESEEDFWDTWDTWDDWLCDIDECKNKNEKINSTFFKKGDIIKDPLTNMIGIISNITEDKYLLKENEKISYYGIYWINAQNMVEELTNEELKEYPYERVK